jgi:hypothetical protein
VPGPATLGAIDPVVVDRQCVIGGAAFGSRPECAGPTEDVADAGKPGLADADVVEPAVETDLVSAVPGPGTDRSEGLKPYAVLDNPAAENVAPHGHSDSGLVEASVLA